MKSSIKNNTLFIEIPLQTPTPSATGKNLIVASTRGNIKTDQAVNGSPLTVSVNAYIKPSL